MFQFRQLWIILLVDGKRGTDILEESEDWDLLLFCLKRNNSAPLPWIILKAAENIVWYFYPRSSDTKLLTMEMYIFSKPLNTCNLCNKCFHIKWLSNYIISWHNLSSDLKCLNNANWKGPYLILIPSLLLSVRRTRIAKQVYSCELMISSDPVYQFKPLRRVQFYYDLAVKFDIETYAGTGRL